MKFGGVVEEIISLEQLQDVIRSPGEFLLYMHLACCRHFTSFLVLVVLRSGQLTRYVHMQIYQCCLICIVHVQFSKWSECCLCGIFSPGVSVLYFMATMNKQCAQITPSVDSLCSECPALNFLKVNVDERPLVASAENVRVVPSFKIYKDGTRVKEMVCPSLQVLRYSVRHYAVSSS
nr:unknown [Zea mays]